jgi:trans-aconitate methyltransferase
MSGLRLIGEIVLLIFLLAVLVVGMLYLIFTSRNRVPFVRTPRRVLEQIRQALQVPQHGHIWDLGCGDGHVLAAVRGGLHAHGIDNNPLVLTVARWRLGPTAQLRQGDILSADLTRADRVFCYLGPELMARLEPRFIAQLPRGARVVSMQFPLPNRTPDQVIELKQAKPYARTLYVYDY